MGPDGTLRKFICTAQRSPWEGFRPLRKLWATPALNSHRKSSTLIDAGADALGTCSLSIRLADGPTIQNANLRSSAGVTPAQCFEMLALIRENTRPFRLAC